MPETLTISLTQPIAGCRLVGPTGQDRQADDGAEASPDRMEARELAALQAEQKKKLHAIEEREQNLTHLCGMLNSITSQLNDLYQETIAQNRSDVAKLAVEIARKILNWKIQTGDYDIHTIIEEALKRAPTRQELVVRVNPEDLQRCQQLQQETPDSSFAELNLVADWAVARAGCQIETPKGIVRSFVEEHLGRIAEALERAQ